MKVHIATSREIGLTCKEWAKERWEAPHSIDFSLTDNPEESDVFISVMYGHLVSEEFISKRRCYNFHPGILPQYRGAGAFSWAIINGDKECGITLHELDVNIDTGPIILCRRFAIEPWDTAGSLFTKGIAAMYDLFKEQFFKLLKKDYTAYPQDESLARTYYRKDLNKAMDLTRYARAFEFHGKPSAFYTNSNGEKIEVKW